MSDVATADALRVAIGLVVRRLRAAQAEGDLTLPETAALARLDRAGPMMPSALARLEGISPQSIGATLTRLEKRGLVSRKPDPADGRRAIFSLTKLGQTTLRNRRNARTEMLAEALRSLTPAEVEQLAAAAPLIERLAQRLP
jgi:DNA-binding MarR family transcriptional regulator